MTNKTRQNRIRFFQEHAGYATPPGRPACAKALADAEDLAEELELHAEWQDDPEGCSMCECCPVSERREVFTAFVLDASGNCLASLGKVCGVDDNYQRVVEAELYQEAIEELTRAR